MQGVILSVGTAQGLILGDDGREYTFAPIEWQSADADPDVGMRVDFEAQGSEAADIYLIPGAATATQSQTTTPSTATRDASQAQTPAPPAQPPAGSGETKFGEEWWHWILTIGALAIVGFVLGVVGAFAMGVFGPSDPPANEAAIVAAAMPTATPAPTATTAPTAATTPAPATQPGASGQQPFELDWDVSDSTVEVGESFTLRVWMSGLQLRGEHGGISVSFPSLTVSGGGDGRYSSSVAEVEVLDYTSGLSNVAFHQPGATIYRSDDVTRFPAEYLLVESDDAPWPRSAGRTLRLRITPKRAGEFRIQVRGWICEDGYTDCSRSPAGGNFADQQGHPIEVATVQVEGTAAAPADDHGDSRSDATRVEINASARGSIETEDDADFFAFSAVSGRSYTIETRLETLSDSVITLYDSSGSRIDDNDDISDSDRASRIEWTAPSSRTRYVKVEGYDDETGAYRLEISETQASAQPVSPANGRIVFQSNRDGDFEIYVMNADGSGQTRLTDNEASDGFPSWSPDERRIVFQSHRDGDSEIYVMNADGSGLTRLTDNEAWDWVPSWSPDGRRIAFMSGGEIYVMNADGSGQTRLTDNEASDGSPSWSPDGRRIVFSSNRDDPDPDDDDRISNIYAMNADGSGQTRLTYNEGWDGAPSWSPDGRRIAFQSDRDGGDSEIYVMNADGSGVRRLTDNDARDSAPSWSPDGRRIAFHSSRDGNYEIYVMNADGSGQTRLTDNEAYDYSPSWSPTAR